LYNFQNIPALLQARPNWLVWRETTIEDRVTKVPYSIYDGMECAVTDRRKLGSFKLAIETYERWQQTTHERLGIGFSFFEGEGITGCDIDPNKQTGQWTEFQCEVYNMFPDTYCEWSPSGKGVHVIMEGEVPTGKRSNGVELYSSMRYFTFTGNLVEGRPVKLADYDEQAHLLWQRLGGGNEADLTVYDQPQSIDDQTVYERIAQSAVGKDFEQLWQGNWKDKYESQSLADQALTNYLQFATHNVDQIKRLFWMSALGKRKKAHRPGYLELNIRKSFDLTPPPVDLSELQANAAKLIQAALEKPEAVPPLTENVKPEPNKIVNPYTFPPGLMGELASYLYYQSPRPIAEVALAGAMALMGGFCGRAYNIGGAGLNVYILLLAKTGTGKDAIANGIDRLFAQMMTMPDGVMPRFPAIHEFRGPSEIASGQGLMTYIAGPSKGKKDDGERLARKHSFVMVTGEFGYRMQQMASPRASTSELALQRNLLDLYTRSGHMATLGGTAYADIDKSVDAMRAPAVSIFAETTPSTFWEGIEERQIKNGLLPRFLMVDYSGKIVSLNEEPIYNANEDLLNRLCDMLQIVMDMNRQNNVINVQFTPDAKKASRDFGLYCDDLNNATESEVIIGIWSRANLSISKLASLVAVGVNPYNPVIDMNIWTWARNIVVTACHTLLKAFQSGKLSANRQEIEQQQFLERLFSSYFSAIDLKTYSNSKNVPEELFYSNPRVITRSHIMEKVSNVSAFKQGNRNYMQSADFWLKYFVDSGVLVRLTDSMRDQMNIKTRAEGFVIGNLFTFD
jgi:hypothetical protein